jgi:hypothetical protein
MYDWCQDRPRLFLSLSMAGEALFHVLSSVTFDSYTAHFCISSFTRFACLLCSPAIFELVNFGLVLIILCFAIQETLL